MPIYFNVSKGINAEMTMFILFSGVESGIFKLFGIYLLNSSKFKFCFQLLNWIKRLISPHDSYLFIQLKKQFHIVCPPAYKFSKFRNTSPSKHIIL